MNITPYYKTLNVVIFDVHDNDEVEDRNSNADTNMHKAADVANVVMCVFHLRNQMGADVITR